MSDKRRPTTANPPPQVHNYALVKDKVGDAVSRFTPRKAPAPHRAEAKAATPPRAAPAPVPTSTAPKDE
jgi:hypothetical protein